jgi:hypothetical protein
VNLLRTLGVEIGVRLAGSPEARRAAEAIAAAFRELGLEPHLQKFHLVGYDPDEPELEVDGERWDAGPCVYSPPTADGGAEGRVRYLGDYPALPDVFEMPTFAIEGGDGAELARLYAVPIEGGGACPFPAGYAATLTGPSALISKGDADRLRGMNGARARLKAGGRLLPGLTDCNVIAELEGESNEAVVVSAHFDSVWRGNGTIDNATGVEGVRRIAERLVGRRHARTLIFCAFGAEEYGLLGSRYYVDEAKLRGELDRIVGVVNLDCIAHGSSLEVMVGPDELRGRALEQASALGLTDRYDVKLTAPSTGTDHYYFAQEKIPAASVLHFPYPEYHMPSESLDLVDEEKMDDAVELATRLVESQLERPVPRM